MSKDAILTERLKISPSNFSELPELNMIYSEVLEYFSFEQIQDSIEPKICLTHGDLPPGGVKENFSIYSIYENEKLIGYFDFYKGYPQSDIVYICLFFIKKNRRNCGFGHEIVNTLFSFFKNASFSRIRISVSLKNWPALLFWHKCGFNKITKVSYENDFVEKGYGCLELEKIFS